MPKYRVLHTPILHGEKGDKVGTAYGVGDPIELTEEEAARLGDNVEPVPEETETKGRGKNKPQTEGE